ncbi:MAG: amylo-alpha-1,6-glucosidase [Gemmataceae bacterium]|nr:amylo-alpha-1,6-glucosidase [Gemmataceae bacterium]
MGATMDELIRKVPWAQTGAPSTQSLLSREWLVTNGLGGYASGTVAGVCTRRYHGLLVAALPNPLGRRMMFNHLSEQVRLPDGSLFGFGGEELPGAPMQPHAGHLAEFRLEMGLPVWRYDFKGVSLERRVFLPHRQNTVSISYRLLSGAAPVRLQLRPSVHFRGHDEPLTDLPAEPYGWDAVEGGYELSAGAALPPWRSLLSKFKGWVGGSGLSAGSEPPPLRLRTDGGPATFTADPRTIPDVVYPVEERRGYEARGGLWSPGHFEVSLPVDQDFTLIGSAEPWEKVIALGPSQALEGERERRRRLLHVAHPQARTGIAAELVLAADQFPIAPVARPGDVAEARAAGKEACTVIAGYHWFTDWGRDTMISLDGLGLCTGRHDEARLCLLMFAEHRRDGLIPNLFPEGAKGGEYNTADATLWLFHAVRRYLDYTGDRATLRQLLPKLKDIIDHHLKGTRFGIAVDPADGLLRQGAEGYPLTWMDAKVGDWVVTPRRGKAVEINALWYNALRLLEEWVREEQGGEAARPLAERAEGVRRSFNERFWCAEGGYLYDVVDGEDGDDSACRPNQVLAISLRHSVLDQARWEPVLAVVRDRLLTPVGLRSLAPGHPDYKSHYFGDQRARDAAYHQGTVWPWLIGPFIDAWLKVHPDARAGARRFLEGFVPHLGEAALGTISEILDAEEPFTPRGTIAQAWSVAEVLRCWVKTSEPSERTADESANDES